MFIFKVIGVQKDDDMKTLPLYTRRRDIRGDAMNRVSTSLPLYTRRRDESRLYFFAIIYKETR